MVAAGNDSRAFFKVIDTQTGEVRSIFNCTEKTMKKKQCYHTGTPWQ